MDSEIEIIVQLKIAAGNSRLHNNLNFGPFTVFWGATASLPTTSRIHLPLAKGEIVAMAILPVRNLFLDIGGVLLTNGWDHDARHRAAETFGLDYQELNERHYRVFDTYEAGKLSLDEYLDLVIFYEKRPFTPAQFKDFMFAQSKAYPEMIDLIKNLRSQYPLKVAVISNEGRELTEYRIRKFELGSFIDFFISSSFVHFRKPDADIYQIAINVAQAAVAQSLYIEDRPLFVEVARKLGIPSLHHQDYLSTRQKLADLGLSLV
jgi:putative hydrolase of the HAD superfamily